MRRRHAFEGRMLEILGWQHRRGELLLTLVLPDGTRSLIPASWTDLHETLDVRPETLATVEQLLRARLVVDALLRRAGVREAPGFEAEEREHELADEFSGNPVNPGHRRGVDHAHPRAEERDRPRIGASDRKDGSSSGPPTADRREGGRG